MKTSDLLDEAKKLDDEQREISRSIRASEIIDAVLTALAMAGAVVLIVAVFVVLA